MMLLATIIAWTMTGWLLVGLVCMPWIILRGLDRIDPAVSGSSRGFRLIMIPSAIAFWPLLLKRALQRQSPSEERTAHKQAAGGRS